MALQHARRAIELFCEQNPRESVRQCQRRKRHYDIGIALDHLRDSVGATDDEGDRFRAIAPRAQPLGEAGWRPPFPALVERYEAPVFRRRDNPARFRREDLGDAPTTT